MNAYIIGGYRSAIGKAPRGAFKFTRPDDIAAAVIRKLLSDFPQIEKSQGGIHPRISPGYATGEMLSSVSPNKRSIINYIECK